MSIIFVFSVFISGICVIISLLYLYFQWSYTHWKKIGNVKFVEPKFPFGNLEDTITGRKHIGDTLREFYNQYAERYVGIWTFAKPVLLVKDLKLIKNILNKDFDYFNSRGFYSNEKHDPLSAHLLTLDGERWKDLREKLSPAFAKSKLNLMFPTIFEVAQNLEAETENLKKDIVNISDLCLRYTVDVIGSLAFGVEVNSLAVSDVAFKKVCINATTPNTRSIVTCLLSIMAPKFLRIIRLNTVPHYIEQYLYYFVNETCKFREKTTSKRKDIMQLLIQLRNNGHILNDGEWLANIVAEKEKHMSVQTLTAQLFNFILAGFEPLTNTMSFCLYELAKHQDIQEMVFQSVKDVYSKHKNVVTFETIQELQYLEQCLDETLRFYPITSIIARQCTKDYVVPESDFIVRKGTDIMISLLGLHFDEQYFPKPNEFNPDRFSLKNKPLLSGAYMPFGDGPRVCIGMNMTKLAMKLGLATIILKYRVELAPGMDSTLKMNVKGSAALSPDGSINLKLIERN